MRALLIALLIVLLPLRGWVGDTMAVSMWASPAGTAIVATDLDPASTALADNAEPATDAPCHDGAQGAGDGGHAGAHLLCDVCNGPLLHARVSLQPIEPAVQALRIERSERFASLAPRQGVKPPIA